MSTAPIPNIALASFKQEGTFTYSDLLSDGVRVVSRKGTCASGGAKRFRGEIVNINAATGVISTAVIGTTDPNAVIAENVDPTAATVEAVVYLNGKMKADAIIWPPTGGHAAITELLRDYGILIESVYFRDGTIVKSVPSAEEEASAKAWIEKNKAALLEPLPEPAPAPEAPKPTDSPWAYLTAEEREKQAALANITPEPEPAPEQPAAPGTGGTA